MGSSLTPELAEDAALLFVTWPLWVPFHAIHRGIERIKEHKYKTHTHHRHRLFHHKEDHFPIADFHNNVSNNSMTFRRRR